MTFWEVTVICRGKRGESGQPRVLTRYASTPLEARLAAGKLPSVARVVDVQPAAPEKIRAILPPSVEVPDELQAQEAPGAGPVAG